MCVRSESLSLVMSSAWRAAVAESR